MSNRPPQLASFQARRSVPPALERSQSKRSQVIHAMERPEGASVAGNDGHRRMAKTYCIRIPKPSETPNGGESRID